MFGNNKKIEELEKRLNGTEEKLSAVVKRLDEVDVSMDDFKKHEENKDFMKNSDEPWADFTVELTENDGRVKVNFDWNKAMIQELRRQGFNASTEEDIISSFFARLISEHGEAMSHEELDEIRNA